MLGKRRRAEGAAPVALSARHAAMLARIECDLAELANAAPGVPQLAEMLQLSTTLLGQQQQQQGAAVGEAAAVAPFDAIPLGVVEIVLLLCDANSLARISCASRFFGGGQQRSLVERVVSSPARLSAVRKPALRPHEVMSRTLQLRRLEEPVPLETDMLCELGGCNVDLGRREEAARFYRRAIEQEPDDRGALLSFALMMTQDEAGPSERKEAESVYRRLLVLFPDDAYVRDELADLLSHCGEPSKVAEAKAIYQGALVLEPDNTKMLFSLARMVREELGGCDEAEALLKRAYVGDPNNLSIMGTLADMLSGKATRDDAIALYRRMLELAPNDTITIGDLAGLLSKEPSGCEEAEVLFRRAMILEAEEPDGGWNTVATSNLARMLSKEPSRRKEAETLFRQVLVQREECEALLLARGLNSLGHFLSRDPEQLDEAEQLLRRSLAIKHGSPSTPMLLGVMLSVRGSADALAEARQLCEGAVKVASEAKANSRGRADCAHALAALGIVLLRSGDAAAARDKLDESKQAQTKHFGRDRYPNSMMKELDLMLKST